MPDAFSNYITSRCALTDAELEMIRTAGAVRYLRKKQFLQQEGDISLFSTFIIKGCMRMYRVDEQGNEHILRFETENCWMMDKESYLSNNPSKYFIDAIEDCQLLMWPKEQFSQFVKQIPSLRVFLQKMVADSNIEMHNRLYESISASAEEKYLNFIKTSPDVFNRVPLHMIASYLGVSRETLSRVRNQFAYK